MGLISTLALAEGSQVDPFEPRLQTPDLQDRGYQGQRVVLRPKGFKCRKAIGKSSTLYNHSNKSPWLGTISTGSVKSPRSQQWKEGSTLKLPVYLTLILRFSVPEFYQAVSQI